MYRKINYLAVIVATIAAFVASASYYIILSSTYSGLLEGVNPSAVSMTPEVWQMVSQFVRNLVVAFVLAYFMARFGIINWKGAVQFGFWIWFGFEAMAIIGAVIHEGYPFGLYAIHAGDALFSTLVMTSILGVWAGKNAKQK